MINDSRIINYKHNTTKIHSPQDTSESDEWRKYTYANVRANSVVCRCKRLVKFVLAKPKLWESCFKRRVMKSRSLTFFIPIKDEGGKNKEISLKIP